LPGEVHPDQIGPLLGMETVWGVEWGEELRRERKSGLSEWGGGTTSRKGFGGKMEWKARRGRQRMGGGVGGEDSV